MMGNELPLPEHVIDFLQKEYKNELQRPDDISVQQAAELWGLSKNSTRARLDALVTDGKMLKFEGRLLNGKRGVYYRIIE